MEKHRSSAAEDCPKCGPFISLVRFLPLFMFAGLVLFCKLDLLIAAPLATFLAIVIYLLTTGGSFGVVFDKGLDAVRSIGLIFFILMFAYAVAECFMATGVGASMINLALLLGVTARTIAPVSLLVTCLLSVATGSSWGTFAACAPIFLWLSHLISGDPILTVCAIAGGSCFGDNIGMISDVTVLSCGMQNVKIIDRVKHQLFWSLGCLAVALGIFYTAGMHLPAVQGNVSEAIAQIPEDVLLRLGEERPSAKLLLDQVAGGVPFYMVIPVLVVIGLSFLNCHTILCLGAGVLSSLLLGSIAGTIRFADWFSSDGPLYLGFSSAGSWVVVMMMWVAMFGGIMNAMDAFAPLKRIVVRLSGNIHHLMGWCGVLCLVGNAALADEAAQVATMSPIVRSIVESNTEADSEEDRYTLRLRLATFTSSMGIYGSELIPWHCFPVFFASIASTVYPLRFFTPLDIIGHNYMSFLVIASILLLTFTGWDRFLPGFGLPKSARLKKKNVAH